MYLNTYTIQYYYQSIRALIKFILENIPVDIPFIGLEEINNKIEEFKLTPDSFLFELPITEWDNRLIEFNDILSGNENLREEYREIYNICQSDNINSDDLDQIAAELDIIFPLTYSNIQRCDYIKNYISLLLNE